jgi:hypothetical protein
MATYTLSANSNFSTISTSVNSGDTIALNGFKLTLDVGSPSQTGVTVTAAGNAGTVILGSPTTYNIPTWTLQAGTAVLMATVPTGTTLLAQVTGGSANGAYGISNNYGSATGTGGSVSGAYGISNNYGSATGTGGSANGAYGISNNYGSATGTGGSVSGAYGIGTNYGSATGTGGSANGAHGIATNYGSATGTGGSVNGAYGIGTNWGNIVAIAPGSIYQDNAGRAIGSIPASSRNIYVIAQGSALQGVIPAGFTTIYYTGTINPLATINGSPTLVKLDTGGSGGGLIRVGLNGGING